MTSLKYANRPRLATARRRASHGRARTLSGRLPVLGLGITSRNPHPGASMSRRFPGLTALLIALAGPLAAQAPDSATVSPFRSLALPAPNDVRTGSGRPGHAYWQQRVDYRIRATLDPERHELRGQETIHYLNRSPDRLPYLWLFL